MKKPLQVLSLGAGVQSTTVLFLSIHGELPPLDAVVFADTGWEPQAVYDHFAWIERQMQDIDAPFSLTRVSEGDLRNDSLGLTPGRVRFASVPYHIENPDGTPSMGRRSCTSEYKITPVERFIRRELLGLRKGQRAPAKCVEQWMGISTDEMRRVRVSRDHWRDFRYPLVYELGMSRQDCLDWMEAQGYPRPPRSSCVGCPYHSNHEWRSLTPEEFQDAVEFDRAIRKGATAYGKGEGGQLDGEAFLHRSRKPLDEVDLRTDVEKGQGLLFPPEDMICDGMCGL
jgi:hypothetical protein